MARGDRQIEDADEAAVADFLGDPASHDDPKGTVEKISTHGARVFLTGARAYKVKRWVRLDYLDFTTLEARRRYLARELELNRPNAPAIYRRLVAIERRKDGCLAFGDGSGAVVDWALEMARFPQQALLSNVAEEIGISDELARELAEMAVRLHADAAVAGRGATTSFGETVAAIMTALRAAEGGADEGAIDRLGEALDEALQRVAPLLDRRAAAGRVRRCHGDLHLGNIVMWEGRPVAFDALEFDEALATIDVLYDLAFLLMDLDRRGGRRAANLVLNGYLADAFDPLDVAGLAALPVMLAVRAAVRAMVALDRARTQDGAEQEATRAHAGDTIRQALAYLAPARPRLIAVGGLSGTGKTTLARGLAPAVPPVPGAIHLRSDVTRKQLAGVGELERLPAGAYTPEAAAAVYRVLTDRARAVLAAGHSVVVDAVYARPGERDQIARVAEAAGVPFDGLWLEASPATMTARVAERTGDASDATPDVVTRQLGYDTGAIGWRRLHSDRAPDVVLSDAMALLALQP